MDTETQQSTTTIEPRTTATNEPRSFLATFLLTCMFGALGLRHFYLGDKKIGWIRSGLFAGGYLWIFLMAILQQGVLAFLGITAITVAVVWAVVDFFYVYFSVRTDHDNQPLVSTNRDKTWAKVLFWATVGITAVLIILSITVASYAENAFRGQFNEGIRNTQSERSLDTTSPLNSPYNYQRN